MNQTEIAYIGGQGAIIIRGPRGDQFKFNNRVPRLVPDQMAAELLRERDFVPAAELSTSLEERCAGGRVLIRRWGAMGDLIQVRAAVSAFRRRRPDYEFVLRCNEEYRPLFDGDPLWLGVAHLGGAVLAEVGRQVSMDMVAEVDHRGVKEHRVALFGKALTNHELVVSPEDWILAVPEKVSAWVADWMQREGLSIERGERERPVVGLQVRGSSTVKTVPIEQMKLVAAALADWCDVVLLEGRSHMVWTGPHLHSMVERDALHTVELMRHLDLAVVMDSGPLWMAHAAPCQVLALLGPTREEERLTLHPFYPTGARGLALNKRINCPACFEGAQACAGKFTCIRENPDDVLVDLVVGEVRKMLNGDPPGEWATLTVSGSVPAT